MQSFTESTSGSEDDAENSPGDDDSLIVVEIDSGMFHCSRDGFFCLHDR